MSSISDDADFEEESPDPRVKDELERLNVASQEINKLELELEQSRKDFRILFANSSISLERLYKKSAKFISRARPYYSLFQEQRQAQEDAQNAVIKFQRANGLFKAAKEMVMLTEEKISEINDSNIIVLDAAWQEMLNHAIIKFNEAENERTRCEKDHILKAKKCAENQKKLQWMENEFYRSIPKAKPYFEKKTSLENQLQRSKLSVEDFQKALANAKKHYKDTMKRLENISEEIHMQRLMLSLPERTPGVGAEADEETCDINLHDINLETLSSCTDFDPRLEGDECSVYSFESTDFNTLSLPGSSLSSFQRDSSNLKHAISEVYIANDFIETDMKTLQVVDIDIDDVFVEKKSQKSISSNINEKKKVKRSRSVDNRYSDKKLSLPNQVLSIDGLKCRMLPDPKKLKSQECEWKVNQQNSHGKDMQLKSKDIVSSEKATKNSNVGHREEADGTSVTEFNSENMKQNSSHISNLLYFKNEAEEYVVESNDVIVERL